MTTTISNGTTALTPQLVDGYEAARESGNLVHSIIGSTEPAITLRPANMRSGELRIVVGSDRALALQFEALLAGGTVCALADTDVDVAMSFVVTDSISTELDDETRAVWIVVCGFQEVAA